MGSKSGSADRRGKASSEVKAMGGIVKIDFSVVSEEVARAVNALYEDAFPTEKENCRLKLTT